MKLKELREQKGLSQYEIAPLLNIKRATYANYETGKTQPTIEILCQIADFYGVSLDYLCDHKTQDKLQLGYLTDTQKIAINLILKLNENNLLQTIGYLTAQIQNQ